MKQGKSRGTKPRRCRDATDNPLREISNGDVRVQGETISELEREARAFHPQLYNAHMNQNIGKHSILSKLFNSSSLKEDFNVGMSFNDQVNSTATMQVCNLSSSCSTINN